MKLKVLFGLVLSILSLTIVGCGGGGGASAPPTTTVSGEAFLGAIKGADVKFFKIVNGALSTQIPTLDGKAVITNPDGSFSAVIGYSGPVKVVVTGITGSSYTDEATHTTVDYTGTLHALVANVSGTAKVAVTPYTEIAVLNAKFDLSTANITKNNTAVAEALNLKGVDIVGVLPSTSDQYKFALAVISQAAGTLQSSRDTLLADTASAIGPANTITDTKVITAFLNANVKAFGDPLIFPQNSIIPGFDPHQPATVTLTADQLQGITQGHGPVTLSANVTQLAGGPVPTGTIVNFTSTGTGVLTAITAANANGIATATLNDPSSDPNTSTIFTSTITAKAGTITSSPVSVGFIEQPVTATLQLTTSGAFPAGITKIISLIGTVSITPAGVSVKTAANPLSTTGITASSVTLSGAAAALTNNLASAVLLPAEAVADTPPTTPPTTHKILVPLASINGGFGLGEFATIVADITPLTFPKRGDFVLTGFKAFGLDATGAQVLLPDVTVDFILSLK